MLAIIEKRIDEKWYQVELEDGVDKALWAAKMMSDHEDVDTRVILEIKKYYGQYRKEDAELQEQGEE